MSRRGWVAVAVAVAVAVGTAVAVEQGVSSSPHGVTSASAATVQPIRAAFYYPWFPQAENWSTQYHPALGKYDSSNPTILATHISEAKYAGLDAFISSWWGQGDPTDVRLPALLNAAAAQSFSIAPYYEPESLNPAPSDAQLQEDLSYLFNVASSSTAWLRIGGKPVLFTYNTGAEASCAGVTRIVAASGGRFYVNAKVFQGYRACSVQPDSWHQYGPAVGYDQQDRYAATVSPGFFKFNEASPRLARDPARFTADLQRQVASGAQWQLTTTFNEWGEGTAVEPATEWQSPSGMGVYLDAMRSVYLGQQPQPSSSAPSSTPLPSTTAPTTTAPTTTAPSSTVPPSTSDTGTTTTPTPTPTTTAPSGQVSKVLVFVEENHSLSQMKAGMPYLYSQATKYGYASNYKAITHPSLPNYLAIASGSTFAVKDDAAPASHPEPGPSVFGAAISAGATAKSYQETMTTPCQQTTSGAYAVKHNPWAYVPSEATLCKAGDVPAGTSTAGNLRNDIVNGALPVVGEVTPNLNNDAHDGSLATADNWLKAWLTLIYASPDWKSGRLAVIVTADEDANNQGNLVLTSVLHPSLSGKVVTTALNHYSLTRALTDLAGAPCIRNGCTAPSLLAAFGL